MTYDPRLHGARCSECPLFSTDPRVWRPVPPENASDPILTVLLEAPGKSEVERMRPAVGRSGAELESAIKVAGFSREDVSITNTLLCRPPNDGGDLDLYLHKLKRSGYSGPTPIECCAPRVRREIRESPYVLALGAYAAKSLLGADVSIMNVAGAPDTWTDPDDPTRKVPVLPTVHPAFVLRLARWREPFRAHVGRAFRRARGVVEWVEPKAILHPSADEIANWLEARAERRELVTHDTETTFDGQLRAKLRCAGFYSEAAGGGIVIPWRSCEAGKDAQGRSVFYTPSEAERIDNAIRRAFDNSGITWAGWNTGYFDATIYERHLGARPTPDLDLIMVHRLCVPELPHSLDFVGRMLTDTPTWKQGKHTTDDRTLWIYNNADNAVVARVAKRLWKQMNDRGQRGVWERDVKVQEICRQLHRIGMYVVEEERQKLIGEWQARIDANGAALRDQARELGFRRQDSRGREADFNPGSTQQVGRLLFEHLGLDPVTETALGDPSTEDSALRELMASEPVGSPVHTFLSRLRKYRRAVKMRGTYLTGLEVWDDGRVRATWNAHVTIPGRVSCSDPGLQQIPWYLRSMYGAAPGHSLVYADMAQLHLRVIAAISGDDMLVRAFAEDADPHAIHGEVFYRDEWRRSVAERDKAKAAGDEEGVKAWAQRIDQMRQTSKTTTYAAMYLATLETVHKTVTSTEDGPEGNLLYGSMPMRATRALYEAFWKAHPKIRTWGDRTIDRYRRQGYLEAPIGGRRLDFLDGEPSPNDLVNFPVLASETGLMIPAKIKLVETIPFGYAGPGTGLVHDGHDSLMLEVPDDDVPRAAAILRDCMTQRLPWTPVPFTADVKVGKRWDNLKKWKG